MGAIYDAAKRLHDAGTSIEVILDTIRDMEALKPQRKPAQPKGTRLTADWQMPTQWIDWALAEFPGMPEAYARQEADKFKDYWISRGRPMVDWLATWRNWMRKAVEDRRVQQERRGITRGAGVVERRRADLVERHENGLGTRRERNLDPEAVRQLSYTERH